MSESAAKADRRAIRRAFGPRAVDEVVSIAGEVKGNVATVAKAQSELIEALNAIRDEAKAFREQSFWGRVRWLVLGV